MFWVPMGRMDFTSALVSLFKYGSPSASDDLTFAPSHLNLLNINCKIFEMKFMKFLLPAILVLFALSFANGQKLTKDAVVACWNFSPKEQVNTEDLEDFLLREYIPEFERSFTGTKLFLLRNDRGNDEGGYSILAIFESLEVRDRWWPQSGEPSDEAKKATEKMKEPGDRMMEMIEMKSWNDWLVL